MQVIGFNLNKISAQKENNFKRGPINTNIEFTEVDKEKSDMLRDSDILKISYKFIVTYSESEKKDAQKMAELLFQGDIAFSAKKDEVKEITKAWKKKQIPENFRIPLINFILRKCSTKSLVLEEDLNLPVHIPFPQIRTEQN